ncbi:uncharacterized protein A4U43_C02F21600 [Asparagus officinalis]|uniref:Pectinesterase inhibitor domain-containing protein n=1 Tax=Asparagus officinalis TaxID=4686 RepID=A0A5P1FMR8_ASPOF|nr:uncharacterized protein A4U43_C02F21600 [Asparagus officinalis]
MQAAGNTTDPNKLIQIAFSVTIEHIRSALKKSETLLAAEKDPRMSKALKDCRELFDYARDDLRNCIDRIEILDITKLDNTIDDLKIWLSAVVKDQETCLDGFENASADAAKDMKKALQSCAQLTSNCLAIIDSISKGLTSFKLPSFSSRLLSSEEEGPSWVNPTKRMLPESKGNPKPDLVMD